MPHNKAEKTQNRQNKSSILEETVPLKPNKQREFPPSLNEIPKQES
ncbi:hypothetical protein V3851_18500 [Paenibacillus sp. M1]|uniref:Uncharacterized protein n=1 Tax=Paenibacillus haidiansis TaxID=1574488 RepID=A0ABU7VVN3_9BACL